MLVLTRKYQEKIRIGENITITVLRMKGKAVRLGIEAPADVPVVRGELAFEAEGDSEAKADHEEPELDSAEEELPGRGRKIAHIARAASEWTTESSPSATVRPAVCPGAGNLKFTRVSREKVAEVLPTLVGGAAPLRSMMGRC